MPKRKPPPEKRVWARSLNGDWQIILPSGEKLTRVATLTVEEARRMTAPSMVLILSFGQPVREIAGSSPEFEHELAKVRPEYTLFSNSLSTFRGDRETAAIVFEWHH